MPAEVPQQPMPFQLTDKIPSCFGVIGEPVADGFVAGFDGFGVGGFSDREERAESAKPFAEFSFAPVEQLLQNINRQRFTCSENCTEHGFNRFLVLFLVGELAGEELMVDAAESLRELIKMVEREVAARRQRGADLFGVEENAFALVEDSFDDPVGVGASGELRRERMAKISTEVVAVGLGAGVEHQRVQALERTGDRAFGAAGDDEP